MTNGGWVVMLLSVSGATAFFIFCISRVLRSRENPDATNVPEDVNLDSETDSDDASASDGQGPGR